MIANLIVAICLEDISFLVLLFLFFQLKTTMVLSYTVVGKFLKDSTIQAPNLSVLKVGRSVQDAKICRAKIPSKMATQ